ncbi:hypothetical protein IC235_03550 [Hymenobacter sp. BT664]|uniref:Uncharacterized protein n=1 Tax=Hymenobacter montanus TaxID=2771359 RepID=A0A927BAN8_9BACT|nr:hypothetical protein [Hymenobacter montanus]MBD2766966.1 hypothetical protein [Hymenobacter montanus]
MYENNRLAISRWWLRGVVTGAALVGLSAAVAGQTAPATIRLLPEDAQRGLNGAQHNFDFLAPGVRDTYQTAGFFGQKLRPYLAGNQQALSYLNLYRRQKTQFLIDRLIAVGSFGVYGQQIFAHGDPQYFNTTQQVAAGAFVASLLATIFINRNTNNYLQRAVDAYNADLSSSGKFQGGIWPRLRPSQLGFSQAALGQPLVSLHWSVR